MAASSSRRDCEVSETSGGGEVSGEVSGPSDGEVSGPSDGEKTGDGEVSAMAKCQRLLMGPLYAIRRARRGSSCSPSRRKHLSAMEKCQTHGSPHFIKQFHGL